MIAPGEILLKVAWEVGSNIMYWCTYKKTEKLFLEISHKIHKDNTCVLESLF